MSLGVLRQPLERASRQSLRVSWIMLKIYIPLAFLTLVLRQAGFIDLLVPVFSPLMSLMGLPGEAAITLAAGFTNSIYAALATMSAFDLSPRQVTILGVVLGIAHSLFVETGILTRLGFATVRIAFFRIGVAIFTGIVLNLVLPAQISGIRLYRYPEPAAFSWTDATLAIFTNSLQIVLIVFSIMLLYEGFSRWKFAQTVSDRLTFLTRAVGMGTGTFGPWMVGMFIGITYGAAMLFRFAEEDRLTHKDICLITIFLCLAHAVIEDVLLFVVVGGNIWWILAARVGMAVFVVRILSCTDLYRRLLWIGLPEERHARKIL